MRTGHTPHSLPAFPIYSSSFISENELVLGGGGGQGKNGVKNKLRLFDVGIDRSLNPLTEVQLQLGEDAPMSMAADNKSRTVVCGVNSPLESLEKGVNENCRVFTFKDNSPLQLNSRGTIPANDIDDFQKVTVLSPDNTLLAVAGAHDFTLLSYPSLTPLAETIHTEHEIYDATFSESTLVIATTQELTVYSLPTSPEEPQAPSPKKSKGKGKKKGVKPSNQGSLQKLALLHIAEVPAIKGVIPTFRSARYHPTDSSILYAAINASTPRTKRSKTLQRQSFVYKWNTKTWAVEKSRKVGDRALTCFSVSADGKFLGYGTSDLTVGLFDASNLSPLVTILKAHELPPTTLTFNPTSSLLVSASADTSLRIVSVPTAVANGSSWFVFLVLLTLFIILLAILAQKFLLTTSLLV